MKFSSALSGALLVLALVLYVSCGKKDSCTAGTGGSLTLVCFPQHHSVPIYSGGKPGYPDSLFIKFSPPDNFNVTSNPADYDLVLVGNTGDDFVSAPNLTCGSYFLYMAGWDTLRAVRVVGGIPYSTSTTSGSLNVIVPVTEQ